MELSDNALEKRLQYVAGEVPALMAAICALIETHPDAPAFLQAFDRLATGMQSALDDLDCVEIRRGLEASCSAIRAVAQPHQVED